LLVLWLIDSDYLCNIFKLFFQHWGSDWSQISSILRKWIWSNKKIIFFASLSWISCVNVIGTDDIISKLPGTQIICVKFNLKIKPLVIVENVYGPETEV
jgi:hypothetical protein